MPNRVEFARVLSTISLWLPQRKSVETCRPVYNQGAMPWAVLLAVGLLATINTAGCTRSSGSANSKKKEVTLRIGVSIGQMFSANPQGGLQQIQQGTAIEPLTRLGDDGRPRPALAEGWDLTPDRRSLTLRLRSGVKFHDGSPVTAATVADILNKTLPKTMGPAFEDVVSIRPINETAIDIQFRAPAPFLLESLEVTIQKPGSAQI